MCGRYRLDNLPAVLALLDTLGVVGVPRFAPDFSPGSQVSIIRETSGSRRLDTAIWWLFLDPVTMKPDSKYASFNSRSDKLHTPRSLAYRPYRTARCLIPATAFIEGLGDKRTYHMIECVDRVITFGGIYKEWLNHDTGEIIYSTSIITLPPVPGWESIHPKSVPLMLDYGNSALINKWLDPKFQAVAEFDYLLTPKISHTQRVTPIGKVSAWNSIGPCFEIPAA